MEGTMAHSVVDIGTKAIQAIRGGVRTGIPVDDAAVVLSSLLERLVKDRAQPPPLVFDARGLREPQTLAFPSFRALQLISRAQFDALPDGTPLVGLSGCLAVQGRDLLAPDENNGFISYGFLR
jgi:hypothetical protein